MEKNKNTKLAGLAYLAMLLSWIGLIVDLIIYYKTKNQYAKFHAGQAIFLLIVFSIILIIVSFLLSMFGIHRIIGSYQFFQLMYLSYIIVILIPAVLAFKGKDFRIPIAAYLLEK